MGEFKKYVPGQIDKESQIKKELSELEYLILKPHTEGIKEMSKEEIDRYIAIDEEELRKTKMNSKTILIFIETKKILKENYKEIIADMKEKGDDIYER